MKKIFTLFVFLCTISIYSQTLDKEGLEIGRAQQFGAPVEAQLTKKDNVYKISFRDISFKTVDYYVDFEFKDENGNLDTLYAMIEKGFEEMPKDDIPVTFANRTVYLKFTRFVGAKVLVFSCIRSEANSEVVISNFIAKKQVDKLFGKKK